MLVFNNYTGKLNNLSDVMTKHFLTIHLTNEMKSIIRSTAYIIQWNNNLNKFLSSPPIVNLSLTPLPCYMCQNCYMTEFVPIACHFRMSQVCEQHKKNYLQKKCHTSHVACVLMWAKSATHDNKSEVATVARSQTCTTVCKQGIRDPLHLVAALPSHYCHFFTKKSAANAHTTKCKRPLSSTPNG